MNTSHLKDNFNWIIWLLSPLWIPILLTTLLLGGLGEALKELWEIIKNPSGYIDSEELKKQ